MTLPRVPLRAGAWSKPHLLPYVEEQHSAHEKNNTNKNAFVPRESPLLDRRTCEQNTVVFTRTIALLLSNASCRKGASKKNASSDPQPRPRDSRPWTCSAGLLPQRQHQRRHSHPSPRPTVAVAGRALAGARGVSQ